MDLLESQKKLIEGIQQPISDGLKIYENNILGARVSAMQGMYPQCEKLLGSERFLSLCRDFIQTLGQKNRDMNTFGQGLSRFITGTTLLEDYPLLLDLARLEACKHRAYWAPKRQPFNTERFSRLTERQQCRQLLYLAADVGVLESVSEAKYYLVERTGRVACVEQIQHVEYTFLKALAEPASLSDLCSQEAVDFSQLSEQIMKGRIEWTYSYHDR